MTAQQIDDNGYMTVEKNPITRAGVFPYLGRSIPNAPEPDKVYMVYRPAEELNDPECIESFKNIPIIDDHALLHGDLTGDEEGAIDPADKVTHGVTGEAIDFKDNVLYSNIKIFTKALKDRIRNGKTGLSLGYRCQYEKQAGTFAGKAYDYIQRSLRGNHLALVDEPRNDVYVLDHSMAFDSFDLCLTSMEKGKEMENQDKETKAQDEVTIESLAQTVAGLADAIKAIGEKVDAMTKAEEAEVAAEKEEMAADEEGKAEMEQKAVAADAAIKALQSKVDSLTKDGIKNIMSEISKRDALVNRLTPFVGTFDASEMTHDEVAKYGAKQLGIECADGQAAAALNGFLHGRQPSSVIVSAAFDSKSNGKSIIDSYINGTK